MTTLPAQSTDPGEKPIFLGLRTRLLVIFSLVFTAFFMVTFVWFYRYATRAAEEKLISELSTVMEAAASGIDGDDVLALYSEAEPRQDGLTDDPRYWQMLKWLRSVRLNQPHGLAVAVRTGAPQEIAWVVVAPNTGDPLAGPKFKETQQLSEQNIIWQGFEQTTLTTELFENTNDNRVAGATPVYNQAGEAVAVLALNINTSYVESVQTSIRKTMIWAFVLIFIPLLVTVLFISRMITRPILAVTDAARRIGKGDYEQNLTHLYKVRLQDEITELAQAIEQSGRAHLSEQQLRKQVEELKIQIDQAKRLRKVKEIMESDSYQDLKERARELRAKLHGENDADA